MTAKDQIFEILSANQGNALAAYWPQVEEILDATRREMETLAQIIRGTAQNLLQAVE